jgi:hypothetical protein
MATRPLEARSLMDEFLPNHDFSAAYDISINAPSSVVCECLLRSDFNELWLVRLLMSIRSRKWLPRNRMPGEPHWPNGTTKLSATLHGAKEDSELFEEAREKIEEHFDIRRVHKLDTKISAPDAKTDAEKPRE